MAGSVAAGMRGISVIIRVRDERASLERCLGLLARQQGVGEVQVIVVDSGSEDGSPADAALARRRPEWGYSNAAGAFRAERWRRRPFRVDLPACEDKEWALHWLSEGYTCVVDPALVLDHDHTHDSLRAIYRRARREAQAYAAFLSDGGPGGPSVGGPRTTSEGGPAPTRVGGLAREWWSDIRWYDSPCGRASATDVPPGCWARTTAGEADGQLRAHTTLHVDSALYTLYIVGPILGRGSLQLLDGPRRPRACVCNAASDGRGRPGIGVGSTVTVHTHGRACKERS